MRVYIIVWATVLYCGMAAGQQPAGTDEQTRKAIDEILAVTDTASLFDRTLQSIRPVMKTQLADSVYPLLAKDAPDIPPAEMHDLVANLVNAIIDQTMDKVEPDMKKELYRTYYEIYPRYLSTDELEYLANIYREDRILRKAMRTMPDIMRDMADPLQNIMKSMQQAISVAVEAEVPKFMDDLEKREKSGGSATSANPKTKK
jgi:hypothetical protein